MDEIWQEQQEQAESFDAYCEWWQTTGQYEAADALKAEESKKDFDAMFSETRQAFSALFGGRL